MGRSSLSQLVQFLYGRNARNVNVGALEALRTEIVKLERIVSDLEASILKLRDSIAEAQVKWDNEGIAIREYELAINRARKYLSDEIDDRNNPEYIACAVAVKEAVECLAKQQASHKSRQTASGLSACVVESQEELARLQKNLIGYKEHLNYAKGVLARREDQAALQAVMLLRGDLNHQDDYQGMSP